MNKHNRQQRRLAFRLVHSAMGRAFAETGSVAFAKNVGIGVTTSIGYAGPDANSAYIRARAECYAQQRGARK